MQLEKLWLSQVQHFAELIVKSTIDALILAGYIKPSDAERATASSQRMVCSRLLGTISDLAKE